MHVGMNQWLRKSSSYGDEVDEETGLKRDNLTLPRDEAVETLEARISQNLPAPTYRNIEVSRLKGYRIRSSRLGAVRQSESAINSPPPTTYVISLKPEGIQTPLFYKRIECVNQMLLKKEIIQCIQNKGLGDDSEIRRAYDRNFEITIRLYPNQVDEDLMDVEVSGPPQLGNPESCSRCCTCPCFCLICLLLCIGAVVTLILAIELVEHGEDILNKLHI